jgi:hypothetical protein
MPREGIFFSTFETQKKFSKPLPTHCKCHYPH